MGAPARITKVVVTNEVNTFIANLNRAKDLYTKIVTHGYSDRSAATPTKLNSPDSRDAAQFIFFEIAAKFEDFAKQMFLFEVRARLKVTSKRGEYVMGDLDNGLNNKLGWGSPPRLKERGANLFGSNSFFGDLVTKLGNSTYETLVTAHTVRNRIAHDGGSAKSKFIKHLERAGIAANERQGMSIGRYLRDYPKGSAIADRNFFQYVAAYEAFASKAGAALP